MTGQGVPVVMPNARLQEIAADMGHWCREQFGYECRMIVPRNLLHDHPTVWDKKFKKLSSVLLFRTTDDALLFKARWK